MTASDDRADVLIAGAGFAGLALAIALRQSLGETFRVVIADPAFDQERAEDDPRGLAIAAAARRMLAALGVWPLIEARAQPILDMAITDSRAGDVVRPTFLSFAGEVEPGEPFAHLVEHRALLDALIACARDNGVVFHAASVAQFAQDPARIAVELSDAKTIRARLLVAADGVRSRVRERAGIRNVAWSYPQRAIVTTIAHERDHGGRAVEHFLPAGPFAMLPLTGQRCSIVWTEKTEEAERLVALPDAEFLAALETRFGLELGDIALAGSRRSYPLGFALARSFVAERIALVGDAAHLIHPIAGQGLNMGLRDVAALSEAIADTARLGLDPGGSITLERYQRWRRFDTLTMGVATDGLNRLFSNQSDLLRVVRDFGLGVVERLPALKQLFIREAAGLVGDMPKLLKGEAL